ncbi:hypothetical protein EDB89DRAFT_2128736 [Lactarius sanguifluus]|nr:hypothetical protein EDB89DRAFT_2128736 [Lactarius sanguifluus]
MPKNYLNYDHDKYLSDKQHLEDCRKVFGTTSPEAPSSSSPSPFIQKHDHPALTQRGLEFVLEIFQDLAVSRLDKPRLMAEMLETLNTPAALTEGLSPLHWLGLNPLVILGTPTGHLGPPLPPAPPSNDPNLHQVITDVVNNVVGDQFRFGLEPLTALSEELRSGFEVTDDQFAVIEKKLDFLARLSLSPPVPASNPSSPPSSTPVAAPAQDVEMAHPPALAPVVAPVVAPVAPSPAPAPAAVAPVPAVPAPAPVSKPRAKKPRAQPPTPAPAKVVPAPVTPAKVKPAPAPTPAPVIRPTPPSASKPSFASMAKTPARPSLVVSLRPPVAGATVPQAVRRSPQEIVGHLNAVLSSEGHQVTLSAARWTAKNNLVVTAGPDTTAHHLASSSHLISDSLATYLSADQSPLPVQARENCKWARLLINGIPTRVSLTRGPYTSSELTAALHADNPVCRGLRMTLPPSWVRAPASYTPGSTSSVVLTFEDPSGDSLRSLLAERTLFAFGHSGELKRWKAKPRNTGKGAPAASS